MEGIHDRHQSRQRPDFRQGLFKARQGSRYRFSLPTQDIQPDGGSAVAPEKGASFFYGGDDFCHVPDIHSPVSAAVGENDVCKVIAQGSLTSNRDHLLSGTGKKHATGNVTVAFVNRCRHLIRGKSVSGETVPFDRQADFRKMPTEHFHIRDTRHPQ